MAVRSSGGGLPGSLNVLSTLGVVGDLNDGQLVRRCLGVDEGEGRAAFSALVERHGPMVLQVCRQVLGNSHDAEDAFLATFLILLRKAGSIRNADSMASWLHGVACRVSKQARDGAIRRRIHEQRGTEMRASRPDGESEPSESWAALHEEIARLPSRYREPLVLCYLEGLSTGAAAQRLRCPKGTILSRLSRGRERLRDRLTRRGLAPAHGLAGPALLPVVQSTSVPGSLISSTIQLGGGFLTRSDAAAPVSSSVASLTRGVLHAMFWTNLKAGGLVGVTVATLAIGAGATLAYQQEGAGRIARPQEARQETAKPIVKSPDPPRRPDPSTAAFVPLPPRDELHALLRRASSEAVSIAKTKPLPSSWCLATIAGAQARVGDLEGARLTFAAATKEAEGAFGGDAHAWNLWHVGRSQAESGLKEEARATLQQSLNATPGVVGDFEKDHQTVQALAFTVGDLARLGARDDARRAADQLLEFSRKLFETTRIDHTREVEARQIAAALAAAGDFEAAFQWSEGIHGGGDVLGEIALMASEYLDREAASKLVREAAERIAKLPSADQPYHGLSDLATAQARLGDIDTAWRSAKAIGEGTSRVGVDMTDWQPFALICIANVQRESGDAEGARETLREAFHTVNDHPRMRWRDLRYYQIAVGQIASGDVERAARSIHAMTGNPRRPEALAVLARAQAAAGRDAAAQDTLTRALADADLMVKNPPEPEATKQPGPTRSRPVSALMGLAQVQAMAGNLPGALEIVRSLDDPGYHQYALRNVILARATAGDLAGALRLSLDATTTPEERRSALEMLGRGAEERLSLEALARRK